MKLTDLPKLSSNNFNELQRHDKCGCYFCLEVFDAFEVINYVDTNKTGLCPYCGIDALLPGMTNKFFLGKANDKWFTGEVKMKGGFDWVDPTDK